MKADERLHNIAKRIIATYPRYRVDSEWARDYSKAYRTGLPLPAPPVYDATYHGRTEEIRQANILWEEYKRDL